MHKIPKHKMSEKHFGEIAFLKCVSVDNPIPVVDYAHRDDYYLFIFMEKGEVKMSIDFEEYNIKGPMVHCILPGQIHTVVDYNQDNKSWILIADSMLVKEEFREIFENVSLAKSKIELDEDVVNDLTCCVSMLDRRLKDEKQSIGKEIIRSLLSSYIGIIAGAYQKGFPILVNKRYSTITHQFKSLLSVNYKTMKSPSKYASVLNITPIYLNEAVKNTTGSTVTECIQNEIMTQAKRLLFYTDMSIKEIASELGYEDVAYFTRLFTKVSSLSPTQFRSKYLK